MVGPLKNFPVFLEVGKKRTFAGAIEWPGWCRSGHDEASALESLYHYASRYAAALGPSQMIFRPPASTEAFVVIERVAGNATTDFGAPGQLLSGDVESVDDAELQRFNELLKAFWRTFDTIAATAKGIALRKGPRGGGRDLDEIVRHVVEADIAYLARLGCKLDISGEANPDKVLRQTRQATLDTLAAAVHGEIPTQGPRGGMRWTPRYFVRRLAWHLLDHAWEIEDRII